MKKVSTLLLALLIALYSTVGVCLCNHEIELHSDSCDHQSTAHSDSHPHNDIESDAHHSGHSEPSHSHEKNQGEGHSCSCLTERTLPLRLEKASLDLGTKDFVWVLSQSVQLVSGDLILPVVLVRPHSLSPPLTIPIYIKKTSFLI